MLSKRLLIGHRIALGFSVPLAALIIIGFFSLKNLEEMQREARLVTHTVEVIGELRSFTTGVSRLESVGRGYAISGEEELKADFESYRHSTAESVGTLRRLTADNPLQVARLDQLQAAVALRAQLSFGLITARDQGGATVAQMADLVRRGQDSSEKIWALSGEMEREETSLLLQRQEAAAAAGKFTRNFVVYGSALALVVVALGGMILNGSITRPLEKLRVSAVRIGDGDYAHRVSIPNADEVGHVAHVFNAMAAQVEQRQAALAGQDWLKTGLAKLAMLFQKQRDPLEIARLVLNEIAVQLDVPQAALYRVAGEGGVESLRLAAGFATDNPPLEFKSGQGLVGQCHQEGRRILITGTPPDYLRIGSALGGSKPAVVLVEPVVFEGQVKAVLELASFKAFTPLQLEFVRQLAANLGVVLQAVESMLRTEELLRRSQELAVQLEAQKHVLADKNTELEAQADRLRKSELLLQEQQVELTQTNEELEQSNEELQQSNEEMEEKSNLLATQKRDLEHSNRAIEKARLELQEQARQLATTSKYKSDFLATMSHELRTPLNSLLILARLLAENRETNLTAKQVQFAQTIESSGADLLEMINQILDLAKIESGTVELQLDDVSPVDLQRSMEQQFRHVAETKQLGFTVSVAEGLPAAVHTDVRRLHQVLKNLLSNAFKFTERGSVSVEIRPVTQGWRRKSASLEGAAAVVAIAVSDTGIGIAKDKQQIVFESFQQADAGTSRRFGGTGLGLSISREIALMLGGVLQLESEEGKGSTFTLFLPARIDAELARSSAVDSRMAVPARSELPVSEAPAALAQSLELADMPAGWDEPGVDDDRDNIVPEDRVILIIEDDTRFSAILVDFAREKRFKALVARSARHGMAMAQRFQPVAITLDLRLIDEDGWLVLDRLKHDERTRHIPVHVISVEPARGRGLRLGAVSYLQKPVSKEAITEILQQTVDFIERPVKSLLVVEDDMVQRDTIRELIGNGDVHTTTVGSAAEALEALAKEKFDCIVMDLMLPDKPGVQLIREINTRLGLQAPPVIVYTGKDLSPAEETELRSLSESIIVKDARSPERLLDETALFLHRVQSRLPESKRRMLEQVRKQDALLTGRRVLVVDDDVRNIFALTARLEAYGMIVTFAESGKAAIDQLQADPVCDVVLMDVMMPEMDGYEAIRRLRADSRFARLPIISVTAKAMKGDRERCIEAGASDYITKPVDTEKLISLLRVWLYR
ncbi:two-component system sensor histidine kinase/response regulator [Nibricoccus aquaticus]|uniref:histidine kinase n=1 Tax=Nibricoccus aquaticus TaxID=2576891 RepID=A0A290QHU9_9BACT|nr:response regulator [Nibricoccus aquaticus]ATC65886.1 two-component system sensor histidine kinase/response regulator [Nibricoccus aquaticus]